MPGDEIIKSNPEVGVDIDYTPPIDDSPPIQRLYPHIFPANKGAWSRFRGALPQVGSVLKIIKPPS